MIKTCLTKRAPDAGDSVASTDILQASIETGKRFTTARVHVGEKKEVTGLKTYKSQREFLKRHGFSVQKFFDKAYIEFLAEVYTSAV